MTVERFMKRTGRRGAFIIALAVAQLCIGWTNLTLAPVTVHQLTLLRDIPIIWLGLWWIIPAGVGVVSIIINRFDSWALYLSYLAMFTWAFIYAVSVWPLHELPAGVGLRTAGIFWAISLAILPVAGWQENLPQATIPPLPPGPLYGPDDIRSPSGK